MGRLEAFEDELPAKKLVGLWKGAFGDGKGEGDDGQGGGNRPMEFEMERAREMSTTMRDVGPLDGEFLGRMWRWVEEQAAAGEGGGKGHGRSG